MYILTQICRMKISFLRPHIDPKIVVFVLVGKVKLSYLNMSTKCMFQQRPTYIYIYVSINIYKFWTGTI